MEGTDPTSLSNRFHDLQLEEVQPTGHAEILSTADTEDVEQEHLEMKISNGDLPLAVHCLHKDTRSIRQFVQHT